MLILESPSWRTTFLFFLFSYNFPFFPLLLLLPFHGEEHVWQGARGLLNQIEIVRFCSNASLIKNLLESQGITCVEFTFLSLKGFV